MKSIVTLGELMLRLSPPDSQRIAQAISFDLTFGGSEANVAVSIAGFGQKVEFVSRMPENDISQAAKINLKKQGVGTKHILLGGDRLGIYYLENGASLRGSKVIYDREHSGMATLQPGMIDWDIVFENCKWFHWSGITPAISDGAAKACAEAIDHAKAKSITISTDLNYRQKLWKYGKQANEVMPEMVAKSDVMLGDVDTCEKLFGIKVQGVNTARPLEPGELEPWCQMVQQEFPNLKVIASTLRHIKNASENNWSGVLYESKNFYQSPWYNISNIVDRVGAGDAFMGALIYKLSKTSPNNQEALDFAVAASALKHTISGDFNLITEQEVNDLLAGARGKISR